MNPVEEAIKRQRAEEERIRNLPNILSECFDQQLNFIKDPAPKKILCTPRRSGKSTTAALSLVDIAIHQDRSKLVYVNTTKGEAKNVMYHNIFEEIFIKLNLEAELIDSKNEIRFSNGSIIYLHGADATPKEMNKLRGKKFGLAIVDECQNFTQDLAQLINQALGPTLADMNAACWMLGTAGNQMGEHYWYLLNKPNSIESLGWKKFFWSWKNNPHVKKNVQKYVDGLIAANPLVVKTPWFRQEYLGEWVPDTDARVYRSEDANYIDELPKEINSFKKRTTYILSIDLGYIDATAYTITAYNQNFNTNLYVVESKKVVKQTITDVANEIKVYMQKYNFSSIIVDASNLQAVEEMRKIHSLPLIAADKPGKEAHIALINSDFITKNVLIVKNSNQELIKELNELIWDPKSLLRGVRKEQPTKDNHLTDSLLYAHHYSRHYWFRPLIPELASEEKFIQKLEESLGVDKVSETILLRKAWWEENEEM